MMDQPTLLKGYSCAKRLTSSKEGLFSPPPHCIHQGWLLPPHTL